MKESSDELNPPTMVTGVNIARAPRNRTPGDYAALALATFGVGFLPLAPGTWGAAVGVGIYLLLLKGSVALHTFAAQHASSVPSLESLHAALMLLTISALSFAGVWAATRAEKVLGRKDPGAVVVDEVAGQMMAFLFVPLNASAWIIVAGFLAFRLFDIWKPYPIRRLEALEAGLGIMGDDLLAGAYAAVLLSFITTVYLFL